MPTEECIRIPGERICRTDKGLVAGRGTYECNGQIYSSVAGMQLKSDKDGKVHIEVQREMKQNVLPEIGMIVTAKVTNVNPRQCKCAIISVETTSLSDPFRGVIRSEDVRSTERDKVEMYKCFKPGDVILARVLSLGDAQSYILTTAENELGVVIALSESGATMVPISWNEMQCPATYAKEYRKVAKVQSDHITQNG
ncbi:unnamed protein product [Owenia fusiformis]|uniref:Uncharacterized protein n=1 Tax=Owenia fusiformis TaxID=6347 RepID=A0A8J1T548_OWEFU|nr:unnamed protein product [Owenia fusiformis]